VGLIPSDRPQQTKTASNNAKIYKSSITSQYASTSLRYGISLHLYTALPTLYSSNPDPILEHHAHAQVRHHLFAELRQISSSGTAMLASPPCIVPGLVEDRLEAAAAQANPASFNVGHGDRQVRSDMHTNRWNIMKEEFERNERSSRREAILQTLMNRRSKESFWPYAKDEEVC
jgi:hypothetical protein